MKFSIVLLTVFLQSALAAQTFLPQSSGVTTQLNAICFSSSSTGVVVGKSGVIRRTTDVGLHWDAVNSGTSAELFDVAKVGASTFFAVGQSGTIIKSINSGSTWTNVNSGTTEDLYSIFVNGQYVFITGENGTILKSSNYGSAWSPQTASISLNLRDAYFTSATDGFIVGDAGTLLKTTNGGTYWSVEDTGITGFSFTSINFPDGAHGTITAANSGTNNSAILYTDNGGATWSSDSYSNTYLNQQFYADYYQGFVVGGSISGNTSSVYKTVNYGESWVNQPTVSSRQLGVFALSTDLVFTCGLNGTILRYAATTLDLENTPEELELAVFPNPGLGIFKLKGAVENQFEIVISDALGSELFRFESQTEFDLSALTSGVYFLIYSSDNQRHVVEFLKD